MSIILRPINRYLIFLCEIYLLRGKKNQSKILEVISYIALNLFLFALQIGQTQEIGNSSNGVPAAIP